ncbi:hypothetical protein M404DRAFT_998638 [Pisolithus tinctorius Marx 270]|uniref:Uncharacterized protein n=1 Tax=Pisolithus tinctorius Marx 270 TaxID=870435 RepID=A0A0C3KC64_PISTI|nr:hypothetical protein M404DRAFT_998638 [Pisolithus tinctorius Marx 270]
MPRLLPRLIKKFKETPLGEPRPRHLDKRVHVPSRKKGSFQPIPERPSYSVAGRVQSILLDDQSPVTNSRAYIRHKGLSPRVLIPPVKAAGDNAESHVPREMTAQEREWWSSPYLRMLSSPIRWCTISRRHKPSDFLIRLTPLQLPVPRGAKSLQVWMPDGLEHPKFRGRKGQLAMYLTCWKDIFSPENFSRIAPPRAAPKGIFHKLLATQISHLLRLRIIQELQLLEERLLRRSRRDDQEATILRRLTRAEFKELRETGELPHRDAVAVVVAPPVNRDRITKNKPAASIEPEVPSDDQVAPSASDFHRKVQLPLSTLHKAQCHLPEKEEHPFSSLVPTAQVPLYNGLTMFPSAPQRAMLHKALCKVLNAERHSRLGQSSTSSDGNRRKESTPGCERGSHAFLLISNERTVKRADSAALAIALWRLRMWEGDAYQGLVYSGGWEVDGEWRMNYLQEKL